MLVSSDKDEDRCHGAIGIIGGLEGDGRAWCEVADGHLGDALDPSAPSHRDRRDGGEDQGQGGEGVAHRTISVRFGNGLVELSQTG